MFEQVSAYENYVTSLKFKISFLNSRTGVCIYENYVTSLKFKS